MRAQPSSEHLVSLEACFLCSEIWADDPAVTHASLRVIGFSGCDREIKKLQVFLDPSSELEHLLAM